MYWIVFSSFLIICISLISACSELNDSKNTSLDSVENTEVSTSACKVPDASFNISVYTAFTFLKLST